MRVQRTRGLSTFIYANSVIILKPVVPTISPLFLLVMLILVTRCEDQILKFLVIIICTYIITRFLK